jgi:hypothetical protein
MPSYTYHSSASELSRPNKPTKSTTNRVRSDSKSRKRTVHAPEVDAAMATKPTLDDFGGRSDALGG